MKKVFAMLLLVFMIFMFSVTAHAEAEREYFLDGKFSMETPDTYYYFGKDTPEDSAELKEIGFTKDELLEYMGGADDIYISKKSEGEILVFYGETDNIPFEFYTAPERIELQKELESEYEKAGYEVIATGIDEGIDADFVYAEIAGTDEYYPVLIYRTIHNGIFIQLLYIYYGEGEISDWDISRLANYAEFYGTSEYYKNTYPVEYTVEGIKTKFTLPGGWALKSNVDSEFIAIKSKNILMAYFCYDGWENELTEEDRSLTKRSDYNMELFTEEDLKEIIESDDMVDVYGRLGLNIIANSTEMTKCGEYDCVSWKLESKGDEYVFDEATAFMCIENGIVHIFFFTGPFEGKTAEEFKGIIAGAKFPEITDEGGEKAESAEKSEGAAAARVVLKALRYGIVGSVIAGLGSLIKNATKEIKDKKKSKEAEKQVVKEEEQENKFCRECGAQLDENDKFCPVCGTKVKK